MTKIVSLPLDRINPFDPTHRRVDAAPGFECDEEPEGYHLDGARHCARMLEHGVSVRPIVVCASSLVPAERRNDRSDRPWQRLDGFKRYWGHVLAGRTAIDCLVIEEYRPGAQHGMTMTGDG